MDDKRTNYGSHRSRMLQLAAVVIIGALLRLYDLGAESYWRDEIHAIRLSIRSPLTIIRSTDLYNTQLFWLSGDFWQIFFGTSETSMRLVAAIPGIAAIPALYLLGTRLFGHRVALLSAFLLAISEFQIYYAQSYRPYTLVLLFTLLSYYGLIVAVQSGRRFYWALYVAATILGFLSHYFTILILLPQSLYFLFVLRPSARLRRTWFLWQLPIALVVGVVGVRIILTGFRNLEEAAWIRDPAWWELLLTLKNYLLPSQLNAWSVGAAALLLVGSTLVSTRKSSANSRWLEPLSQDTQERPARERIILLLLWLVCPLATLFIVSKLLMPTYVDRYTMVASPAIYLLLALLLVAARKWLPQAAVVVAITLLVTPGLALYYINPVNEQWREVATYIAQQIKPGDIIVFAPSDNGGMRDTFNWYYPDNFQSCGIDVSIVEADQIKRALDACVATSQRFWLVLRPDALDLDHLTPLGRFFILEQPGIAAEQRRDFKALSVFLMRREE